MNASTMQPVRREEILDYVTYGEQREQIRAAVLKIKEPRRIHLGPHMTFLFENRDTVRYQIQEMVRVERLVKESEIQHEIETYNELLGGPGELGASLLIEIDDPAQRAVKLVAWRNLMDHVYARLEDGSKVMVSYDRRQVGDERLSSVQYVRFATGGRVPVALGSDHPDYAHEDKLTDGQRRALAEDLGQ